MKHNKKNNASAKHKTNVNKHDVKKNFFKGTHNSHYKLDLKKIEKKLEPSLKVYPKKSKGLQGRNVNKHGKITSKIDKGIALTSKNTKGHTYKNVPLQNWGVDTKKTVYKNLGALPLKKDQGINTVPFTAPYNKSSTSNQLNKDVSFKPVNPIKAALKTNVEPKKLQRLSRSVKPIKINPIENYRLKQSLIFKPLLNSKELYVKRMLMFRKGIPLKNIITTKGVASKQGYPLKNTGALLLTHPPKSFLGYTQSKISKGGSMPSLSSNIFNNLRSENSFNNIEALPSIKATSFKNYAPYAPSVINSQSTPAMIKQWSNGVYNFNTNFIKNLPHADHIVHKLLKSFFTSKPLEYNYKGKINRLLIRRLFRLSLDTILVSKPEIKHFSDNVNITVFLYNKKKSTIMKNIINNMSDLNFLPLLTNSIKGLSYMWKNRGIGLKIRNPSKNYSSNLLLGKPLKKIYFRKRKFYLLRKIKRLSWTIKQQYLSLLFKTNTIRYTQYKAKNMAYKNYIEGNPLKQTYLKALLLKKNNNRKVALKRTISTNFKSIPKAQIRQNINALSHAGVNVKTTQPYFKGYTSKKIIVKSNKKSSLGLVLGSKVKKNLGALRLNRISLNQTPVYKNLKNNTLGFKDIKRIKIINRKTHNDNLFKAMLLKTKRVQGVPLKQLKLLKHLRKEIRALAFDKLSLITYRNTAYNIYRALGIYPLKGILSKNRVSKGYEKKTIGDRMPLNLSRKLHSIWPLNNMNKTGNNPYISAHAFNYTYYKYLTYAKSIYKYKDITSEGIPLKSEIENVDLKTTPLKFNGVTTKGNLFKLNYMYKIFKSNNPYLIYNNLNESTSLNAHFNKTKKSIGLSQEPNNSEISVKPFSLMYTAILLNTYKIIKKISNFELISMDNYNLDFMFNNYTRAQQKSLKLHLKKFYPLNTNNRTGVNLTPVSSPLKNKNIVFKAGGIPTPSSTQKLLGRCLYKIIKPYKGYTGYKKKSTFSFLNNLKDVASEKYIDLSIKLNKEYSGYTVNSGYTYKNLNSIFSYITESLEKKDSVIKTIVKKLVILESINKKLKKISLSLYSTDFQPIVLKLKIPKYTIVKKKNMESAIVKLEDIGNALKDYSSKDFVVLKLKTPDSVINILESIQSRIEELKQYTRSEWLKLETIKNNIKGNLLKFSIPKKKFLILKSLRPNIGTKHLETLLAKQHLKTKNENGKRVTTTQSFANTFQNRVMPLNATPISVPSKKNKKAHSLNSYSATKLHLNSSNSIPSRLKFSLNKSKNNTVVKNNIRGVTLKNLSYKKKRLEAMPLNKSLTKKNTFTQHLSKFIENKSRFQDLKRIRTNTNLLVLINKINKFIELYLKKTIELPDITLENKKIDMMISNVTSLKYLYKYNYLKDILVKEVMYIHYIKLLTYNNSLYKSWFLTPLKNILGKVYNKQVRFNFINLKYIYLSSDLLTQAIVLKLRNIKQNRLNKVLRKVLNLVLISKLNIYSQDIFDPTYKYIEQYYNKYKNLNALVFKDIKNKENSNSLPLYLGATAKNSVAASYKGTKLKWLNYVQSSTINLIKYKCVFGLKLEASGRLTKRSTASRAVFKFKYKGNLKNNYPITRDFNPKILKSNLISNIQYTKLGSKTRNGSFGIKTWINNN